MVFDQLPEPVVDALRTLDRGVATGARQAERLGILQPDRAEKWLRIRRAGSRRLASEACAILREHAFDVDWGLACPPPSPAKPPTP